MIELPERVMQSIREYGDLVFPREACGLIYKGEDGFIDFVSCRNLSEDGDQFVIHPQDYTTVEDAGEVIAVVHTHPNMPATPSDIDRTSCFESEVPWLIMSLPSGETEWVEPVEFIAPLVGRQFAFGVHDCYSVIRDWYKLEKGIELPNFARRNKFWEVGPNGEPPQDLYKDNFEKAGFYRLPSGVEPEVGDVFLMQIRTPFAAHGAVYIGNDQILHHMQGKNQLSTRAVYGGTFAYLTTHHLRYRHA